MAGNIRLIKIASEINIGKDAIVEFLLSKGFSIENKATSQLSEDMVNAVYDKFKKEKKAAENQRKIIEQHKQIHKTADSKNKTKESEPETPQTPETPAIPEVHATPNTQLYVPETEPKQETVVAPTEEVKVEAPKKEEKAEEPQKVEVPSASEWTEPQVNQVIQLDSMKKHDSKKPAKKEVRRNVPADAEKKNNLQQERKPAEKTFAPRPAANDETPKRKFNDTPRDKANAAAATLPLTTDDADKKRKKRKKLAEVELDPEITSPKLKGLTIVGKIDIKKDVPPSKPSPRNKNVAIFTDEEDELFTGKSAKTGTPKVKKGKKFKAVPGAPAKLAKKKKKVSVRDLITTDDVDKAIKQTLSEMGESSSTTGNRTKLRMKKKAEREEKNLIKMEEEAKEAKVLHLTEFVTTADLAKLIGISANEIIMKCIGLGIMVSINQRLDKDTISIIADDYGLQVEFVDDKAIQAIDDFEDASEDLQPRSPIVTIMGHVDHGKTSLLDYIRNTNVVAGEAGGITQHIGAYRVKLENNKYITFLDTPGHEAFTAMRARGAQVTDIVILVVSADDSVMPQTIEAISHSLAANVPIIVAINKIDKPDAQPDRIRQQLADHNVLVEDWGGKYQCVNISAKKGINIDILLEKVLLEAEMLDLKANPDRHARCTVIEANMAKGLGPVCTIIVQKGMLSIGDSFVVGHEYGRVRAMVDERGNKIESAKPSMPVRVIGLNGLPEAGDILMAVDNDVEARHIANERQQLRRQQEFKRVRQVTLDDISKQIHEGDVKDLNLIIKGDVGGSVEALSDSLQKLSTDEVRVNILHKGVGTISESDVTLAVASGAIIIGFQVSPTAHARKIAEAESVDIRQYNIIYDCIDEVKRALEGLLTPELKEDVTSVIEVRKIFKISRLGVIAGCQVMNGKIHRNDKVRLLRDGLPIFTGYIDSLKRNKDDVREVDSGYECGIALDGFNDIEVGDTIEGFKVTEIKRKLD